ncbi:MAG: helix-turn-helix domain-containing protein [Methanophagales archaeon]|nr:helix-turn-helix domain-containing protein [Methanophagales archaeon]
MNNAKREYFPYLRIGKMNELLKGIPLQLVSEVNEFSAQGLAEAIGVSITTVSNLIATLKSLGFIEGERKFRFTAVGDRYTILIRTQEEEAKRILQQQVKDIEYFQVVKQRLGEKEKLTNFEIGNLLVTEYNKKWRNPLTLKAYGAGIASILDFVGSGYYRRGGISVGKMEGEEEAMPVPYLSADKIFKILHALTPSGADIHTLSRDLGTQERRLSQELACCQALGFVAHPRRGFYELTEEGKAMVSPYMSDSERRTKFTGYLVSSRYKRVMDKLPEDKITVKLIGDVLESEYGKKWSELTKKTYAKKFLNWLRFSGLVERVKGEKGYILNVSVSSFK